MKESIEFFLNKASETTIAEHLLHCDANFVPPLSSRVDIIYYAKKIANNAIRFEAWSDNKLIGLIAIYCNDHENYIAYMTSVSVLKRYSKKGIAAILLQQCIEHATASDMFQIVLEVHNSNFIAIKLYEKYGFVTSKINGELITMNLNLQRDYNHEIKDTNDHKYAYCFDFDVMHYYMIRSFEPFFNKGKLLELGSFKGDFTKKLLPYFDDITCVEGSNLAIEQAKQKLGDKANFVNALFEKAILSKHYENIVLTHVLEHLDDPVLVLKRINDEWLSDNGRLFIVCPNANAPSRQIAVKMGLITHNTAITPAEIEHGHRRTYTLDTLEHDVVAAGLKVVHRTGIFFKALANFQWDLLLQTDIISQDYLEGCYKLGQHYPDLCSSIFLLCERGENK